MQTFVAPKLQAFMEAQWLRVFSIFLYHLIAQSVKSLENQIVCFKMHQRENVKKGNLRICKFFFKGDIKSLYKTRSVKCMSS